jgi:hypothetical protein
MALRYLEDDFGMRKGSLVMYCPPAEMNTKIADVCILVDDDVTTLDTHETNEGGRGLTGGHLAAQKARFGRLWRIMFAVDPSVRGDLQAKHLYPTLIRGIHCLVLGVTPVGVTLNEEAESVARELANILGLDTVPAALAARSTFTQPYPSGAPRLGAFLADREDMRSSV